jgi:rhodanese-related sulfurtransferase
MREEQFEKDLLSPTPSSNNILRRSKSMIENCSDFFKSERSIENIKNKEDFIILSPTPVAPRRRRALFSTSSIDSVASTSKIASTTTPETNSTSTSEIKKEEEDNKKENNFEEEENHDTKIKNDSSNLDYSSPTTTTSESLSFSKLFPKRICRTYSECSLEYLKNWKDASSFGHGEDSILPYNSGKDSLKRITADTLSNLLQGKYEGKYDEFHIIDCRFPYEYEGGHICNAKNINDPKKLYNLFFNKEDYSKKVILIFHCEFSSERGPWMAQFFRKADREKNRFFYPRLHYPEVYVLKGGYKEFYKCHKELCSPQKYVEMADSKYIEQCKRHRKMFKKAKSTSELYYSSKYQQDDEDFSTKN